jgi:glucosylceramidase
MFLKEVKNMDIKMVTTTRHETFLESDADPSGAADNAGGLTVTDERTGEIYGFGGCFNELGIIALDTLGAKARGAVFDDLFGDGGCKFNYCRLPVGANDFAAGWYSYNDADGDFAMDGFSTARDERWIIPYVKKALEYRPDMLLFASPWSPPEWLKDNKKYNGGRLINDGRHYAAYAKYLVKYLCEYMERGIRIDMLHVQNEPTANQIFPSCLMSYDEMLTFARDFLLVQMRGAGLKTELWLGTINSPDFNEYAFPVFAAKGGAKTFKGIGYQWAGKEAIVPTRAVFPQIKTIQTESECGDGKNTFAYAEYIFSKALHYIRYGARAYTYWNMVLGADPRSTWGWAQNSLITVDGAEGIYTRNPEYYVMKHFSAFIKRGARVLRCADVWSAQAVAFLNPDGETVIAVQNPLNYDVSVTVNVGGRNEPVGLKARSFNTLIISESK